MKQALFISAVILFVSPDGAMAQVDVAKLAETYKSYDMTRNDGKGHSDSVDRYVGVGRGRCDSELRPDVGSD